ncbi:MAG: hypothetical protein HQL19_07200 [Candidatus Omnitrophica bacterium]|nr:hypothetical protein [Candidatus Omnitrophota bacterium]
MIPQSLLKEFGFIDEEKFPRRLNHHSVSLSLPTALNFGVEPLEVIVEDGLVVPLQEAGSTGGMIIRNDGLMLYVGHQDPNDPASPLESRFIKEIPYEARLQVSNIMRRAVAVDPSLGEIWHHVSNAWTGWFSTLEGDGVLQLAGEFVTIAKAWHQLGELLGQLIDRVSDKNSSVQDIVQLKTVVQTEKEFNRGWLGEEILVDELPLSSVMAQGRIKYLMQGLFPKMQKALQSPVFISGSTFKLYYGTRRSYLMKLVILPLVDDDSSRINSTGIEFNLSSLT